MVVVDMEFTKKLLLVDPRTTQRREEYKEIQKSGALQVKPDLSIEMKRIMNSDMPEDEKAKHYAQALERYRSVTSKIPASIQPSYIKADEQQPVKLAAARTTTKRQQKKKKTPTSLTPTQLVKGRLLRRIKQKRFPSSTWLTY